MIQRPQRNGLACAVAALVFDQASKALALAYATPLSAGVEILPVFNLVLVFNRGASFGSFSAVPWWALSLAGLAVVAVLATWLWRMLNRWVGAGLGLVIGGALGNVIDRGRQGAVTDFLDIHWGADHWPAFNFADVAIVGGVILFLIGERRR